MAKRRLHSAVQAALDEHIPLPGCPQIIVTRGWAYNWLVTKLGYDKNARGFASLDYIVFARREVREPLTDLSLPHIAHTIAYMEAVENGHA